MSLTHVPTANKYRPNVLAVFFRTTSNCQSCNIPWETTFSKCPTPNDHCRVLVGLRSDSLGWQFPQGGIDTPTDASPEDALKREIREEIGLEPTDYTIQYMLPSTICYDHDPNNVNAYLKAFKGQEQYWFACSLNSIEIPDLSKATDDEFIDLKWVTPREALNNIVHFKGKAYLKGLTELGLL